MDKITIQSFNAIFSFLNDREDTILWIRDPQLKKPIYISSSVESSFKTQTEVFYKDPFALDKFVLEEDYPRCMVEIAKRIPTCDEGNVSSVLFRVVNNDNKVVFLEDNCHQLCDANGNKIGYMGMCKIMNEQEWQDKFLLRQLKTKQANKDEYLKKHVLDILKRECNVLLTPTKTPESDLPQELLNTNNIFVDGKQLNLTRREVQILHHLMQGKSAKQTAALLYVSPRTVEFHINNIKMKVGCRTKMEILTKIHIKLDY